MKIGKYLGRYNARAKFTFALQVELQSVLFVPLNVAGQIPAGQANPFSGTVFEHYNNRLSCHMESKSELRSSTGF